jgi:hypothetical protein
MTDTDAAPAVWLTYQETHVRPRYFTAEAWATLTDAQRDLIRRQRMAVVAALQDEHERRYGRHTARLDTLRYGD